MKSPDYNVQLAKLKSSVRKTIAALDAFKAWRLGEYLAVEGHNGDLFGGMAGVKSVRENGETSARHGPSPVP